MSRQSTETSGALIGIMRESTWTLRSIASVVILTFGGLVTSPAVAAVKQEIKEIQWHKADASNAAKLSKKVEETHDFLTKLTAHDPKSLDLAASHEQLRALKADLESLDKGAMDEFASNETHIKAHKLPMVIEQRQQDAVKTYRSRMDTLMAELKGADVAKDSAGFMTHVAAAKAHLDKVQAKSFHEKFDPKNMPFSVAKPKNVKPRLTKQDYKDRPVAPPKRAQVAANGLLTGILSAADVSGALPTSPADPSYVAATDDVQITPAIQAQATALNHDPVQIYNWVHNNVEYIPTYGSIQGSDMTLQTLKGNDFDQASLLIALLRASNIPSRYVYGTIQVPIAQVENWVGGVTDPNAALNLLGQGGVPVTGLVSGGQIKYAQLEHVWVEAWVNFVPSRAAKSGTGNTWIPMDASFKQYSYKTGLDIRSNVAVDTAALTASLSNSGAVNSVAGTVHNADLSIVQSQLQNYTNQVSAYISSVNPNASIEDIVGGKSVTAIALRALSASLPYGVAAIGTRFSALPDALVWKFSYQLTDLDGNPISTYTSPTTALAGKTLSVSFSAASEADAASMVSYLPQIQSDGTFNLSNSVSIPGYLVSVIPIVAVNGQNALIGDTSEPIGTQLQTLHGYWSPQDGWQLKSNTLVAGEYHAVGLDLQGISQAQVNSARAEINSVMGVLQTGSVSGLTGHDLSGTVLQNVILSYFATNDSQDLLAQRAAQIVEYHKPSFGIFKTTGKVNYLYGIAHDVNFDGATMDIEHYETIGISKANDSQALTAFYTSTGQRLSLMENVVPEQLLSTSDHQVNGISAVKALSLAETSGQTIFVIDSSTVNSALPQLNVDSGVIADIQSAVAAGKQVTISQGPVNYSGWQGVGYIVYDPSTGTGAYLLDGGANGSWLDALSYVFTSAGWFTGYKAALADHFGAPDIADAIDNYFLKYLTVAAFTLGVLQVGLQCNGARASDVIIGLTAATVLALGIIAVLTPLLGPLALFFIGALLDFAVNQLTGWMESSFCNTDDELDSRLNA